MKTLLSGALALALAGFASAAPDKTPKQPEQSQTDSQSGKKRHGKTRHNKQPDQSKQTQTGK